MNARNLVQELRLAARALRRRPSFTIPTVATLTLGLAAVGVVLSVLRATIFAPLPFPRGEELVTLDVESTQGYKISLSVPNYEDWRVRNRSFSRFAMGADWNFMLTGRGPARAVDAELVLGDWFETLGLKAERGSLIAAARTGQGAEPVVVLSHGAWQRRFGSDPAIVGQGLQLNGRTYTIVGVLEPGSTFADADTEVYIPMGVLAADLPWSIRDSSFGARAIARRMPGVSLAAADADLQRVWREVNAATGDKQARPLVRDLREFVLGTKATSAGLAGLAVLLLYGLAAANALHLALARTEERSTELLVRVTLGADRQRLLRLLAWEGLALAGAALLVALPIARIALRVAAPWLADARVPLLAESIRLDAWVGAALALLALLSAVLLTAVPALTVLGARRARHRGRMRHAGRARGALLIAEVAVTVLLVALASLLAKSESLLGQVDKGFDTHRVFAARVIAPDHHFASEEAWSATYSRIIEQARGLPGIEHAAMTLSLPLSHRSWELRVQPGEGPIDDKKAPSVLYNVVSTDSFATLGIPLLRGRQFTTADRTGAPLVTIVDESLALRFWPGGDALGQSVVLESGQTGADGKQLAEVRTIVGVARNVRHYQLEAPSRIQMYVPMTQTNGRFGIGLELAIRGAAGGFAPGRADDMEADLRRLVTAIDPDLAITRAGPADRFVDAALAPRRQMARLFGAFGMLALALAGAGVFAVMTHAVALRRSELGIRSALGATAQSLLGHVLGGALARGALGVACGCAGAIGAAFALRSLLFGLGPLDPGAQVESAGVVLAAVALAALAPAWSAARADPAKLLVAGERVAR